MKLSTSERLILFNQYQILEFLARAHPDVAQRGNTVYHDPEVYAWYQEVVESGFDILVDGIQPPMEELDFTEDEQLEVLNILDMWQHLQISFGKLGGEHGVDPRNVQFPGWDGNHGHQRHFARLFCYRKGYDLYGGPGGKPDNFDLQPSPAENSHRDTMPEYRGMLETYNRIIGAKQMRAELLTLDEIKMILDLK